ncbi:hypothetical protein IG631_11526 [Alternaria alternata]|nr:hypothetical protein IG631_11526 [Alternaria alternata]
MAHIRVRCQRSVAMRFRHTELASQPGLRLELSLQRIFNPAFSVPGGQSRQRGILMRYTEEFIARKEC